MVYIFCVIVETTLSQQFIPFSISLTLPFNHLKADPYDYIKLIGANIVAEAETSIVQTT